MSLAVRSNSKNHGMISDSVVSYSNIIKATRTVKDRSTDELDNPGINMKGFLFDLEKCCHSIKSLGDSSLNDFVKVDKQTEL